MIGQALTFVVLLSIAGSFVNAQQSDEIFFPGPTERPARFPLHTTRSPNNPNNPTNTNNPTNPNNPNFPTSTPVNGVNDQVSTSTISPTPIVQQSTPSIAEYNRCVTNCPATSEYNPVCGSDGAVYSNQGRLNCAVNCGNPIHIVKYGQCTDDVRG